MEQIGDMAMVERFAAARDLYVAAERKGVTELRALYASNLGPLDSQRAAWLEKASKKDILARMRDELHQRAVGA